MRQDSLDLQCLRRLPCSRGCCFLGDEANAHFHRQASVALLAPDHAPEGASRGRGACVPTGMCQVVASPTLLLLTLSEPKQLFPGCSSRPRAGGCGGGQPQGPRQTSPRSPIPGARLASRRVHSVYRGGAQQVAPHRVWLRCRCSPRSTGRQPSPAKGSLRHPHGRASFMRSGALELGSLLSLSGGRLCKQPRLASLGDAHCLYASLTGSSSRQMRRRARANGRARLMRLGTQLRRHSSPNRPSLARIVRGAAGVEAGSLVLWGLG